VYAVSPYVVSEHGTFEVLKAVTTDIEIFWDVVLCCLHRLGNLLERKWRQYVPLNCSDLSNYKESYRGKEVTYLNELFRLNRAATSLTKMLCWAAYREYAGVTRKEFPKRSVHLSVTVQRQRVRRFRANTSIPPNSLAILARFSVVLLSSQLQILGQHLDCANTSQILPIYHSFISFPSSTTLCS
jgi:hypothetical protein